MNHLDWNNFLAAILADPDDDTARLIAADFLEENAEPDRAAFIRIQVELARLGMAGQGPSSEADQLRAKERPFVGPLSMYPTLWAASECPELVRWKPRGGGRNPLETTTFEGVERLGWKRGFVEIVNCSPLEWIQHGQAVRSRNPIRQVGLTDNLHPAQEQRWALLPLLRNLKRIVLFDSSPRSRDFQHWLARQLPEIPIVASESVSRDLDWPATR
jgi:uncharacterized protein (TIGR02996 family)